MGDNSPEDGSSPRKDFICGVVEGFYGRPWTTEQRKDLFQKLKKWNMQMYVYAPKDDYKHRAYWRELYTVEEAEHLTSLISAAKAQGITFCYALSPGLDITYSSQKEITTLKRKLEQVSQFGCTCFALLFDDIEPEMCEADKQIFQSFAHAQVSVTNEVHQHLGSPRFIVCPTQYCAARAAPDVSSSEYLHTLGTKLALDVDIMWTGNKVISKTLTTESIEEITRVLRRPPVIWDNLHANDYDQKRIFLGPYCGRSPELIPLLRGVLTNPNCEYNANLVAIRTLAHWASCSLDAPLTMDSVSWDIKLERQGEQGVSDDPPPPLSANVYHHRQALRQAIQEWLPEFSIPKAAQPPIIKPQPVIAVPPAPIIPILPSVNTCMPLCACTATHSTARADMTAIPTVSASQLSALAPMTAMEAVNPVSNPVMNSLVSATKVVVNESIPNPIIPMASSNISIPSEMPVSTIPHPVVGLKMDDKLDEAMSDKNDSPLSNNGVNDSIVNDSVLEGPSFVEDKKDEDGDQIILDEEKDGAQNGTMSVEDAAVGSSPSTSVERLDVEALSDVNMTEVCSENGSMQVEPSHSPVGSDMMVEPPDAIDAVDDPLEDRPPEAQSLTADDLMLLCESFYLPFEHGSRALRLLHDYHWLLSRANATRPAAPKTEMSEWRRRRARFSWWAARVRRLASRLARAPNRELSAELGPYVWELCAVLALLHGFVAWLELGKFPANFNSNIQSTYTWFSRGWREAFESGAQEPWVFRGGLQADLRRLLPVDASGAGPATRPAAVRPRRPADDDEIREICHQTCRDGSDCSELFPPDLQELPADRLVMPFLALSPEFCMVLEDDTECSDAELDAVDPDADEPARPDVRRRGRPEIVGYACAALNSKEFYARQEASWIPEMRRKYPAALADREDLSPAAKECIRHFHSFAPPPLPPALAATHGALLCVSAAPRCRSALDAARLLACLLCALRAHGATGVHVVINATDHYLRQFYAKLGFAELGACEQTARVFLGRGF